MLLDPRMRHGATRGSEKGMGPMTREAGACSEVVNASQSQSAASAMPEDAPVHAFREQEQELPRAPMVLSKCGGRDRPHGAVLCP